MPGGFLSGIFYMFFVCIASKNRYLYYILFIFLSYFLMDWSHVFMLVWFALAAYSVIANDSIQTLGTFIESNKKIKWYYLAAAASVVAIVVISYSWVVNGWDISWWRLSDKIPFPEVFTIWHAIAPLILLVLTRFGIPVSTSLLVLSVFAVESTVVSMVSKSVRWYVIAFIVAYVLWHFVAHAIDKITMKFPVLSFPKWKINWKLMQALSTAYLWSVWLMHDMANIAVYLPRQMSIHYLIFTLVLVVGGLFFIFWRKWGKIQHIVSSKTNTAFIKHATIIDFVYACVLLYFKELNNIPMSTTWVFVWLLAGRELAIAAYASAHHRFPHIFQLIGKDLFKVALWLVISIALALKISSLG